jgi:hypothetical protein
MFIASQESDMSIGLAIFLSSLVFALVALYGITRDRWGWRKIVRRATLALLFILALGVLTFAGVHIWDRIPTSIPKQTAYAGLRIGMPHDEVKYVKGYPPKVYGEAATEGDWKGSQPVIETKTLEKDKRVEDYVDWSYDIEGGRIDVEFDPTKTGIIVIRCYSADKLRRCPSILGISDGDTEQEVIRKFGKPEKSSIEGVSKSLYYTKAGIYFVLVKEQVYMLGINDTHYEKR